MFLLPHLVFSPEASLLAPHWLVSLWVCLSSPGCSFVDHGDQARSEVLEKIPHLTEKGCSNHAIHLFIHYLYSLNYSVPHHSSLSQTHSRLGILGAEVWCLQGRSFLCLHRQTLPSHCLPSAPHLVLLKHNTERRTWVAGNVWVNVSSVRLSVRVAHLDGHIQGKDSENAHSSRHTLASLWSGWPRFGAARLTPREITKFSI